MHAEDVPIEGGAVLDGGGQAVDVPELARPTEMDAGRGPGVLGPAVDLGRRRTVRHELDYTPVGVRDEEAALALLPRHGHRLEVRLRVGERAVQAELEAGMVVAGLAGLHQLQAVGLVVAREQRAAAFARALDQPELAGPASGRLRPGRRREGMRGRFGAVGSWDASFGDAALGLLLGDGERDVERVRETCGCSPARRDRPPTRRRC